MTLATWQKVDTPLTHHGISEALFGLPPPTKEDRGYGPYWWSRDSRRFAFRFELLGVSLYAVDLLITSYQEA